MIGIRESLFCLDRLGEIDLGFLFRGHLFLGSLVDGMCRSRFAERTRLANCCLLLGILVWNCILAFIRIRRVWLGLR